jgi:hypothetical protein
MLMSDVLLHKPRGFRDGQTAPARRGEAAKEWITSAFGLTRLLVATALRERNAGPSGTAATALALILVRNMIRTVRQPMPAVNFDVLKSPYSIHSVPPRSSC